tara:strand:+ start:191 stop:700 length:510 start_codon:yes stop_codon:yes gene_type:complete
MKNSTKNLIEEIIELDDCPFTDFEVHGFFIGLTLSSAEQETKKDKILKFLDLTEESQPLTDKLINLVDLELSKNSLEIYPESDYMLKDNSEIAAALSEWTYYFLISYQDSSSSSDDLREKEILDIFDEISQIKQKYQTDDKSSPKDNFSDINSFIIKSVLYLFHRNSNE